MAVKRANPVSAEQFGSARTYDGFLAWAKRDLSERFRAHEVELLLPDGWTDKFRALKGSPEFKSCFSEKTGVPMASERCRY
jgi:hypothetical protein